MGGCSTSQIRASLIFSATFPFLESDYELVAEFYGLDRDLLEADRRLFNQFRQSKTDFSLVKAASDVTELLYKNKQFEMVPEFTKVATILAVIRATSCSSRKVI